MNWKMEVATWICRLKCFLSFLARVFIYSSMLRWHWEGVLHLNLCPSFRLPSSRELVACIGVLLTPKMVLSATHPKGRPFLVWLPCTGAHGLGPDLSQSNLFDLSLTPWSLLPLSYRFTWAGSTQPSTSVPWARQNPNISVQLPDHDNIPWATENFSSYKRFIGGRIM